MKTRNHASKWVSFLALLMTVALACVLVGSAVLAENMAAGVPGDTNPAITVATKTANSVVGVKTSKSAWSRQNGEVKEAVSSGSGVVIREGYVLTNDHVIEDGNSYQVLLPSGEYIDATLVGTDSSTDLAVLKVESSELRPVTIGKSSDLVVGNSVYAIGNPGGEVLANTMTSGIVSALERTGVSAANTTREISYIQHDAPINSGNSGGGLFNVNGELVGINTLKYAGSTFSSVSFEGLGFAIPIDTAAKVVDDLIAYGKVRRAQLGVTVADYDGPDDPMSEYPPASVCVYSVTEGGPAAQAGFQMYDFITAVDGVRVKSMRELTTQLDKHQEGDTVKVTVVRYQNIAAYMSNNQAGAYSQDSSNYSDPYGSYFGDFFGNYGRSYGNYGNDSRNDTRSYQTVSLGDYTTIDLDTTLKVLE